MHHFLLSCKKSENFNDKMLRKWQKTLFLGRKSAIMGQYRPKKFFRKKQTLSPLNNYYFLPSCQKSENFNEKMLRKSQKTLFLGQKSAIMGQYGPKKIFRKKRTQSPFNNYYFLPSCQKSENFNDKMLRKL